MIGGLFTTESDTETVPEPGLPDELQRERDEIDEIKTELDRSQEEVREEIESCFADLFAGGSIPEMPPTERLVEIQDGWEQKRIHENGRFDAWMRESEPGAELPAHMHPDHDRFIVLVEGKITLTIDPGGEDKDITLSSEPGERQVLHLPPGCRVEAESIEGTVTVQVFHPPVAEEKEC